MLFDLGDEVLRCIVLGEDNGFAAQCADFCAADVKDIAEPTQLRQCDVIFGTGECIAETGAVEKQRQVVFPADGIECMQFGFGIESAILRRKRNVNHTGKYHVFVIFVRVKNRKVSFYISCGDLAVRAGQLQHFVTGVLNGSGFVDIYVTGLCGEDALVGLQHRADDKLVGLRAADEKIDFRIRTLAGSFDFLNGAAAIRVRAVAGQGFEIRLNKFLKNCRMRSGDIITGKRNHIHSNQEIPERFHRFGALRFSQCE